MLARMLPRVLSSRRLVLSSPLITALLSPVSLATFCVPAIAHASFRFCPSFLLLVSFLPVRYHSAVSRGFVASGALFLFRLFRLFRLARLWVSSFECSSCPGNPCTGGQSHEEQWDNGTVGQWDSGDSLCPSTQITCLCKRGDEIN